MTNNQDSENKIVSTSIAFGALILIFTLVSFASLEIGRSFYADKTAPRQYFETYNFSGISGLEAQAYLENILTKQVNQEIGIKFKDVDYLVKYSDLGATIPFDQNYTQLKFYNGKPPLIEFLKDILVVKKIKTNYKVDEIQLEKNLLANIPTLKNPKPANFKWDGLALVVDPEQIGNNTNYKQLRLDLMTGKNPIVIEDKLVTPNVLVSDLEPLKDSFEKFLANKFILTYEDKTFEFPIGQNPEKVLYVKADGKLKPTIDNLYFSDFIDSTVAPVIQKEAETIQITYNSEKVEFIGEGKSGIEIDFLKLTKDVNTALENTETKVAITTKTIDPTLVIAPELQAKGIKEIIATGYTTYYGSPPNRQHNIIVGASVYNGMIIKKGATFSFNENLGPVDASTGYLPELVIKSEGTIPEYGGGICQVSTTMYRAALLGGLKIDQRFNHSYAVSYYAQVLGDGLDATIYPGVKDFKFTNDTSGDILMQSIVDGPTITFRFYGTKDERKVELDGPKILLKTGSGAPIYHVKPDLPPGTKKLTQSAHGGLHTDWIRKITYPNGEVLEEVIPSRYRAVPPEYNVSPDMVQTAGI